MKKLFILSFIVAFIISFKGYAVSFVFIVIVFFVSLFLFFYQLIKNKIKSKIILLFLICTLGSVAGTVCLFFFTKYNAKLIVERIDDYYIKHKEYPKEIEILTDRKNVKYHLVKDKNKEYYFLYYYVNREYRHEYDGKRKLWFSGN